MTEPIRNRIVESGTADPTELVENPKNWRVHPEFQREALETVLDTVGWVQDVIVNRTTGLIVDGHLRVAVAVAREEKSIPVKWVELSEAEEATVLATIDPLSSFAQVDELALMKLIAEIDAENDLADLLALIADPFAPEDPPPPDEFPRAEPPTEFDHVCPKCQFGWNDSEA